MSKSCLTKNFVYFCDPIRNERYNINKHTRQVEIMRENYVLLKTQLFFNVNINKICNISNNSNEPP